jgi:putative glycosyltransferase (TIGR04372 family)
VAQVRVSVGGRPVWVTRPNGREYGHLALEILMTLARGRNDRGAVYFVRPPHLVNPALLDLRSDEVPQLAPSAPLRAWLRARWSLADYSEVFAERRAEISNDARTELARELTRHVGDHRVPRSIRERLRARRERLVRGTHDEDHRDEALYYRRQLIRHPVPIDFRADLREEVERAGAELGIERGAKLIAIHTREPGWKRGREVQELKSGRRDDSVRNARIETYFDAVDSLVADGYRVVRIGDPSMRPVSRRGVIDLATHPRRTPALEVLALLRSEFLVCGDAGPHAVSYLTNTPCVIVNASEPVGSFPVRSTGIYIFKKAIDLDTGRQLTLPEMLSHEHYRNLRNTGVFGYRDNTSREIADAVSEMRAGLAHGWTETDGQRRYRELVTDAGIHLAERVRYMHKWGPDEGFLGDGRLADSYARQYV